MRMFNTEYGSHSSAVHIQIGNREDNGAMQLQVSHEHNLGIAYRVIMKLEH